MADGILDNILRAKVWALVQDSLQPARVRGTLDALVRLFHDMPEEEASRRLLEVVGPLLRPAHADALERVGGAFPPERIQVAGGSAAPPRGGDPLSGHPSPKTTEEFTVNWWQIIGPIVLQILQALINRKTGGLQASPKADAADQARLNRWATELEQAQGHATVTSGANPPKQGLLTDVQALIDACRSGDWTQISAAVQKILNDVFV